MRGVVFALALALVAVPAACRRSVALRSEWRPMATRQVSFDAARAPSTIEIRSSATGWVEQIALRDEIAAAERRPLVVGYDENEAKPDDRTRAYFLSEMGPAATAGGGDLARAEAISLWLVGAIAASGEGLEGRASDDAAADDGDSIAMYGRTKAGAKYTCLTTAAIFYDAARAAGLDARRVDLAVRSGSQFETHAIDEVWDHTLGRWIVVDPFFNHEYTVDGRPASAFELRTALASGDVGRIGVVRIGGRAGVDAYSYRIDPLAYFRNVSLRPPDGTWLTFRANGDAITPVAEAAVVQTENDGPFRADRSGRVAATAKLRRASERVAVQIIGGRVYVSLTSDAFAAGSVEFRADDGDAPAFEPDVAPYSPDDDLVVGTRELLANPGATDADGDRVPDGWTVTGSPERAEMAANGFVVEAGDAPCRVSVPFAAPSGRAFVAFCSAEVATGSATFGIAGRRAFATVSVPPGATRTVSSPILRARDHDEAAVELAPHARATISGFSVRLAKGLADLGT